MNINQRPNQPFKIAKLFFPVLTRYLPEASHCEFRHEKMREALPHHILLLWWSGTEWWRGANWWEGQGLPDVMWHILRRCHQIWNVSKSVWSVSLICFNLLWCHLRQNSYSQLTIQWLALNLQKCYQVLSDVIKHMLSSYAMLFHKKGFASFIDVTVHIVNIG